MPDQPTLETTMSALIAGWPAAAGVLASRGMACVGCAMAKFETIGEAAAAYGFDASELLHEVVSARPAARRPRRRR